jgi:magnesium-transporting ATPase (P-type)
MILPNLDGALVECESPNPLLYKFEGTITSSKGIIPLTVDQMLLRGSSLRNTNYIIGLVIFTGHESKIMKNSTGSRTKFSKLERMTN